MEKIELKEHIRKYFNVWKTSDIRGSPETKENDEWLSMSQVLTLIKNLKTAGEESNSKDARVVIASKKLPVTTSPAPSKSGDIIDKGVTATSFKETGCYHDYRKLPKSNESVDNISLCKSCYCMTKDIQEFDVCDNYKPVICCGKCKKIKFALESDCEKDRIVNMLLETPHYKKHPNSKYAKKLKRSILIK